MKEQRRRHLQVLLMCIMVLQGILYVSGLAESGFFQITVIDVGKGDCILIQTGSAENPDNVLIDTGYKNTAPKVIAYLKNHGVLRLDAMIISHFHKDHTGGAATILQDPEIRVSHVYMPDYEGTRTVYREMMDVLTGSGGAIPYDRLTANTGLQIGNAVYTLCPSIIEFDGDNDNDLSMVTILEYDGHRALFAGDLEEEGIREFLGNNAVPTVELLKFPHHGKEETNTGDLLRRLDTGGIAIITDGDEQRASGTLIDTLANGGYGYFCTAIQVPWCFPMIRTHRTIQYRGQRDWMISQTGTGTIRSRMMAL